MSPELTAQTKEPATLTLVSNPAGTSQSPDISIIIVGDVGPKFGASATPSSWLFKVAPEARVWELNYFTNNERPIWTDLLQRGVELRDLLLSFTEGTSNPIVFVCIGLGGLVVKRALATLYERYFDPAFRKLIQIQAGVVFIGTPHPTYKNESLWPRLGLILRSMSQFPKPVLAGAEQEAGIVANVSRMFQETGLEIPILSVYEKRKTKISSGIFKSTKDILVDRELAETSLRQEVMIGCDIEHNDFSSALSTDINFLAELETIMTSAVSLPTPDFARADGPGPFVEKIHHDAWESTVADDAQGMNAPGPWAELWSNNVVPRPPTGAISDNQTPNATYGSSEGYELIPLIKDLSVIKPLPKLPAYIITQYERNPGFYGRQNVLTMLEKALLPPVNSSPVDHNRRKSQSPRFFALCGLGGIGKTQIAIEFAYSQMKEFDAVFWVQADGTAKLDESYRALAIELGLFDASGVGDQVVSRNIMMQWLSNPHAQLTGQSETFPEARDIFWLMVLDNADKLEDLQDFLPLGPSGSVLITSRDPLAKSFSPLVSGIDVQSFDETEAAFVLNKISGNTDTQPSERKALHMLIQRLGGLPLAIAQYGAAIKCRDLTYEETEEVVKKERWFGELEKLRLKSVGNMTEVSVADTWAIDNLDPSTIRVLELLSVLDPDCIHESLLVYGSGILFQKLGADIQDFPRDSSSYYDARTELWKRSLISRNKKTQQISLHRLTQDVVRARMSNFRLQESTWLAIRLLSDTWTEGAEWMTHKTSTWEIIDKLIPHVMKLYSIYEERPTCLGRDRERDLASLLQKTGWHLYEKGSFDQARQYLTLALQMCRNWLEESELLAETVVSLSACTKEMNDPESHLSYAQWHFQIRKRHPSHDILLNGMAYTQLASAYHQVGRYKEAVELAQQGWEINVTSPEFLSGSYYPFYAMIYQVLPLMELGRNDEAKMKLRDTIVWREAKYGRDDTKSFQIGYALHMLGNIIYKQGQHKEGAELWLRAVTNYRKTMGSNYHRTGTVCANLGQHYTRACQYETATVFFDEAERCHALLSYFKPELARTKFLKFQFLQTIRSNDAATYLDEATNLYMSINTRSVPTDKALTKGDFDEIVHIWSR